LIGSKENKCSNVTIVCNVFLKDLAEKIKGSNFSLGKRKISVDPEKLENTTISVSMKIKESIVNKIQNETFKPIDKFKGD